MFPLCIVSDVFNNYGLAPLPCDTVTGRPQSPRLWTPGPEYMETSVNVYSGDVTIYQYYCPTPQHLLFSPQCQLKNLPSTFFNKKALDSIVSSILS